MSDRRRKDLKKTFEEDEGKKDRRQATVEIRKEKRDKILSAKRRRGVGSDGVPSSHLATGSAAAFSSLSAAEEEEQEEMQEVHVATVEEVTEHIRNLSGSATAAKRLEHMKALRTLLASSDENIQTVLDANALPSFLEALQSSSEELQFEATWCLTNIAMGTHSQTRAVLHATPFLLTFVSGSNTILQEQAAWCLGNIAGDSVEFRDILVQAGALRPLIDLMASPVPSIASCAAWAVCNLARGPMPRLSEYFAAGLAPRLAAALRRTGQEEVVTEAAWIITYVTAGRDKWLGPLLEHGVITALMDTLCSPPVPATASSLGGERPSVTPVVRTLGNICGGPNECVDALLSREPRFLPALLSKLSSTNSAIRKESAWTVSSIAGGTPAHCDALVSTGFIPVLTSLLINDTFEVRKEAAYALANLTSDGRYMGTVLSTPGCLRGFLELLRAPEMEAIFLTLKWLEAVLATYPEGARLVDEAGGADYLETAQYHSNPEVAEYTTMLIEKYMNEDEFDESEAAHMAAESKAAPVGGWSF